MKRPLATQIREHYSDAQLSTGQLAGLRRLAQPEPVKEPQKRTWRTFTAVAVVFVIGFSIYQMNRRQSTIEQIVTESVNSHIKNMVMDVSSNSLTEVRSRLNELEFQLQDIEQLEQPGLELQGGRYCSLLGIPAALLRLKEPSNDASSYTLYQVPLPESLTYLEDELVNREQDGISVSIWAKKGVLLVLTGDQPATFGKVP